MQKFKLVSPFSPMGDQEEAIKQLVAGIKEGKKEQEGPVLGKPSLFLMLLLL